jgi:hypothetical protein
MIVNNVNLNVMQGSHNWLAIMGQPSWANHHGQPSWPAIMASHHA